MSDPEILSQLTNDCWALGPLGRTPPSGSLLALVRVGRFVWGRTRYTHSAVAFITPVGTNYIPVLDLPPQLAGTLKRPPLEVGNRGRPLFIYKPPNQPLPSAAAARLSTCETVTCPEVPRRLRILGNEIKALLRLTRGTSFVTFVWQSSAYV